MDAPNQGQSKVKGVVHTWYKFSTKSLSSWNDLQALWYVNGVKVVPQNIFEMLTPISLSILDVICTSLLFIFIKILF